ncbi:5-oxoprolinase subunit PxpA [Formosa sp. S-31]|uniref:5-oxoprolinase subunit PxpA n=1 Tax=Formosa sp. S-31 TaxID=2790949 RepID=UPI003EBB58C2
MEQLVVDINVDVGEGVGNEAEIMPFISSCNIACGGHAGDEVTMTQVVALAKAHRVKIGAHPSFPDKLNFGRQAMELSKTDLITSLKSQIENLLAILNHEHLKLHHVKPHGALYNLAAKDLAFAEVIVEVFKTLDAEVKLYVPFQSVMAKLAIQHGIPLVYEGFADRNYNDDGSLVSRSHPKAMIHNAGEMAEHVLQMVQNKTVKTLNNHDLPIVAETFCIHGDTENAAQLIKDLRSFLEQNDIVIC